MRQHREGGTTIDLNLDGKISVVIGASQGIGHGGTGEEFRR
jgi:hypothetical protein